jgi:aryl-alcohol dehydrogenase-like predicted oxidoreductase
MYSPKIILGTANLGSKYGVSNSADFNETVSKQILQHALSAGIDTFDTAAAYGVAEELLGKTLKPGSDTKVITKIPTQEEYSFEYVSYCLENSLSKLKRKSVYGLMFHDPDILKKPEIREISKRLIGAGKVQEIGFSAYSLEAVLETKAIYPDWTIFQVPENILDRRLLNSTELAEMASSKNSIYVRSVFLQGLLLMSPQEIPFKFKRYEDILLALHNLAERLSVNVLDLCLSYVTNIPWNSGTIVAAGSINQLDEILNYKKIEIDFTELESLPSDVLDPRKWVELN